MYFKNTYKVKKFQKDYYLYRSTTFPLVPKEPLTNINADFNHIANDGNLHFAFLGHSSIFLQIKDKHILIDPVFADYLGFNKLLSIKRFKGPKANSNSFTYLDVVLITHNHYDHLDIDTLKSLDSKTKLFVVPLGVKKLLIKNKIAEDKIIELNWWQDYTFKGIKIISCPAHHTSERIFFDLNRTLWCSYIIEYDDYRIFHSGDSAFSRHFMDIHNNFKSIDLAFIECGQYGQLWHNSHMFPEESLEAAKIINAKITIPIHWGAYALSFHSYNDSINRYRLKAKEENFPCFIPEINYLYSLT